MMAALKNCERSIIKLLEENIGKTLFGINRSNIFLDPSPKVKKIKTKINKWDLIKLESFCTAKETINKMQRQPIEWEKIFANDAIDKAFSSKIYEQLMQLNIKMGRSLQRRHTDGQKAHEKMLNIANY